MQNVGRGVKDPLLPLLGWCSNKPHSLVGFRHFASFTGLPWWVHQRISETCELGTLERFRHVVPLHVICWAVLCLDIALLHLVRDEETPVVDVP